MPLTFETTAIVDSALRLAAALGLCGSCAWFSFVVASRALGGMPASTRACGALLIAYWSLVAVFSLLATLGLFRIWIALPLWVAAAIMSHRALDGADALRQGRCDGHRLVQLGASLWRSSTAWPLLAVAILAVVLALHGMVSPPLAWDALTYHLVRPARWVQTGGWAPTVAPDAWSYYEYFPHAGDVIWAWALLAGRGDAFLTAAGAMIWLSVLAGAYGAARSLGASERRAAEAALALGSVPAVLRCMTSGLIDNTLLALVLLAVPFVRAFAERARPTPALLVGAALGLAAGVKSSALPLLAFGMLWCAFEALRQRAGRRGAIALLLAAAAATAGLPSYARAWWEMGSPLYPLALSLGGREILPGNPELVRLLALAGPPGTSHWPRLLGAVLGWHGPSFGFGPLSPLAIALGAAGLLQLARRPAGRSISLFLLACALLAVPILTDAALWNRFWGLAAPRYLLVSYGALVVAGALAPGRLDLAWLALIASGLLASWPSSFGAQDWRAIAALLAVATPCAIATRWALRRRPRTRRERLVAGTSAAAALLLAIAGWNLLRESLRYPFYEAAAMQRSWDLTPLGYAQSWPVWQALDDGRPRRLAVVAGWDGIGHNWFQYPLFGSRLQNTLLYVPPTRDGTPLDYGLVRDPWSRSASDSVWIERLAAARVDAVVLLPPEPPVEASFVRAHPDRFTPLACSRDGSSCAYRFERGSEPGGGSVGAETSHRRSAQTRSEMPTTRDTESKARASGTNES